MFNRNVEKGISMKELNFINDLMDSIIEGMNIPKVQVERAFNPILKIFIESLLNSYFEDDETMRGDYKLISPEFPLKKEDNKQSTNIDFLLLNNEKKVLLFFELKTDISSADASQTERYIEYKKRIERESAEILRKDLLAICSTTQKKNKYEHLLTQFDKVVSRPELIKKAVIFYLVPKAIKKQTKALSGVDYVWSFENLPSSIKNNYSDYWEIIRSKVAVIDSFYETEISSVSEQDPVKAIIARVKSFLVDKGIHTNPISIQFGMLGNGTHPNYQINFADGTCRTFFFNGKPHKIPRFSPNNISEAVSWEQAEEYLSNG